MPGIPNLTPLRQSFPADAARHRARNETQRRPHGRLVEPHGSGRRRDVSEEQNEPMEDPKGDPQGEDYEAMYKKAVEESRKWEARAKANKAATDKAAQSAEERIADLESRLESKEKAEERAKLVAQVARKKGVPAELLSGETKEDLEAFADKLLAYSKKKPAAPSAKPGSFANDEGGKGTLADYARQLLNH